MIEYLLTMGKANDWTTYGDFLCTENTFKKFAYWLVYHARKENGEPYAERSIVVYWQSTHFMVRRQFDPTGEKSRGRDAVFWNDELPRAYVYMYIC